MVFTAQSRSVNIKILIKLRKSIDIMGSLLLPALLASLLLASSCEAWRWRFGGNAGASAGFGLQIGGPKPGIEGEDEQVGDRCEPSAVRPCGEKTLLSGPEVEQLSEEEFGSET